jgi:class 3 adenylate cyclase/Tfp pilus assembly protein PilF
MIFTRLGTQIGNTEVSNMAEPDEMNRTWLCSVLFMDIVGYSSQSVELQMKWKKRFNGYLADAIQEVAESERVILDTGDGAAVCFLGAPEAAMFAALRISRSFTLDEREQQPGLRVRLGINLGPVKLIRDINGALNAIGDGINAGQRIMSFAPENQILVSQSFFEVVSRLSDDYKPLFQLRGVETDKHVREHTVYYLSPPGSPKRGQTGGNWNDGPAIAAKTPVGAVLVRADRPPKGRWIPWLLAGVSMAAFAAVSVWHFFGSNGSREARGQTGLVNPAPVAATAAPAPVVRKSIGRPGKSSAARQTPADSASQVASAIAGNTPGPSPSESNAPASLHQTADAIGTPDQPSTSPSLTTASASPVPLSGDARTAYDDGLRLLNEDKPAEAATRFGEAIRLRPDYVNAYVDRAEARRKLLQWELSLEDCNKIIQLRADDPRGYNCRGFSRQMLGQPEAALADFNEAVRLNPNFIVAYEHRGSTYELLGQYSRAVDDYTQAIRLAPRNALFYVKRGGAYRNLKQYDKAIRDCTEAIRLQPDYVNAYRLRALAEEASGDAAGAAADRAHLRESPKRKGR